MPKPIKQHTYTAPETPVTNAGRVQTISFFPQTGRVEIIYTRGEEVAGVFTARGDITVKGFVWDDIPVGLQTDLDGLETKAISYAENNGIFPAGAVETDPS